MYSIQQYRPADRVTTIGSSEDMVRTNPDMITISCIHTLLYIKRFSNQVGDNQWASYDVAFGEPRSVFAMLPVSS